MESLICHGKSFTRRDDALNTYSTLDHASSGWNVSRLWLVNMRSIALCQILLIWRKRHSLSSVIWNGCIHTRASHVRCSLAIFWKMSMIRRGKVNWKNRQILLAVGDGWRRHFVTGRATISMNSRRFWASYVYSHDRLTDVLPWQVVRQKAMIWNVSWSIIWTVMTSYALPYLGG